MDISTYKEIIWRQLGAAIDMLENALRDCPEQLWGDLEREPKYWYMVYHTLFWLDFYSSDDIDEFTPPFPFTLSEMDPAGLRPERVYSKTELQTYLEHGRQKCHAMIQALTDESANRRFKYGSLNFSFAELLLYQTRHVQHHAAQLNLLLRQSVDSAPGWVRRTE